MKALRTAAFVIGGAALVISGVGALGAAGALGASAAAGGSIAGIATAASLTSIGAIASAGAAALTLAAGAAAPGGTVGGNATSFKIDKEAGIPVVFGRTSVGGNVVHRQVSENPTGKMKNQLESWVTVLSLGPVKLVGPLVLDKTTTVTFTAGGVATGFYAGNMWLDTQLGACPEARALRPPFGDIPGWSALSKLSGLAADLWSLDFDSKGVKYPNGVPQRGRVVEGVLVYDARQDSTYPGGSGPCRLGDESTYVYSENPGPHAVTWAYGRYQNGVRMAGGQMRAGGIDLQPFVEWSNVCDANGWKVGGQVYTDSDDSWDCLKMICQAGSAEPLTIGAQLSVVYSAPRVSIGTLTSADVCGDLDVPAAVSQRLRKNTIVPSVRLESHGWEMVPLEPVTVPAYVTLDGGRRVRPITYPLVQDKDQGAELAMYDMLNARELDGIVIPAKAYALGYRPGDCLTLQMPDANLIGRDVIVREREIDVGTMGVTFTCRTEDSAKHDFALGKTGTPPPTPDLTSLGIDRTAPKATDWSATGTTLTASGVATPAIVVTGNPVSLTADEVVFDYRPYIAGAAPDVGWTGSSIEPATVTRKEITSVTGATQYEVGVRYRIRGALTERLIAGPVTTGGFAAALSSLDPAAAAALAGKGRTFRLPSAPLGSASQLDDLWYDTSAGDALYSRGPGTGVLAIGGNALTIGGDHVVVSPWLPVSNPQAVKAAADAAAAIAAAQAAASDSVLTPTEKADLAQQRAQVAAEREGLVAKAAAQGLSSDAYTAAYTALVSYLDTLSLSDRVNNSAVDPAVLSDRLTTYYTARTALVSATADLTSVNQVSVALTPAFTIDADYQGNVTSGLPLTVTPKVVRGGVDVRTSAIASYTITSSNCTATVDNAAGSSTKGTITVSAVSANTAFVDLTVTVNGVAQPAARVTITRRNAPAPATGGVGAKSAYDQSFSAIGSTSYAAITDVLTVTLAAGERLVGTAPLDYTLGGTANASATASAKWQYRPTGSSAWSDFGSPITGSFARAGTEPETGHGDFNQIVTGLTAGTFEVQLVAATNRTGSTITFSGQALIEAKP